MTKDLVFIAAGGNTAAQPFGGILETVAPDCWSKPQPDVVYGLNPLPLRHMRHVGLWRAFIGRSLGITGARVFGDGLRTGKRPEERCFHQLRSTRLPDHDPVPQRLLIESRGRWWMLERTVRRIWAGTKTMDVIRDPRDWIDSWRGHHAARAAGLAFGAGMALSVQEVTQ